MIFEQDQKDEKSAVTAISARLKALRLSVNMSQREFCERIKVKKATYAEWELGQRRPSTEGLIAINAAFGVSLNSIVYGVDNNPVLTDIPDDLIRMIGRIMNAFDDAGTPLNGPRLMNVLRKVKAVPPEILSDRVERLLEALGSSMED